MDEANLEVLGRGSDSSGNEYKVDRFQKKASDQTNESQEASAISIGNPNVELEVEVRGEKPKLAVIEKNVPQLCNALKKGAGSAEVSVLDSFGEDNQKSVLALEMKITSRLSSNNIPNSANHHGVYSIVSKIWDGHARPHGSD